MVEAVMKSCQCSEEQAEEYIDGELSIARDNFQADGNLNRAVQDFLSALGLEFNYADRASEMIAC